MKMEQKETEMIEEAAGKKEALNKKKIIIICTAVLAVGIAIGLACAWAFPRLKESFQSEKKQEKLQEVEVEKYDAG